LHFTGTARRSIVPPVKAGIFIALSLAVVIYLLVRLVFWARRRSKGAVVTGAILSMFAPDPTLETNLRLADESKSQQMEDEDEGEPKDDG